MKKLTIQLLTIAIAVIAFSATEAMAQNRVKLDKNGKAKVNTTVKANGEKTFSISGKDFRNLAIKQTNGEKFQYKIKRGSEFLSSGHTTGSNIQIASDGKSVHSITIINNENVARKLILSFINDGTEPL